MITSLKLRVFWPFLLTRPQLLNDFLTRNRPFSASKEILEVYFRFTDVFLCFVARSSQFSQLLNKGAVSFLAGDILHLICI